MKFGQAWLLPVFYENWLQILKKTYYIQCTQTDNNILPELLKSIKCANAYLCQ